MPRFAIIMLPSIVAHDAIRQFKSLKPLEINTHSIFAVSTQGDCKGYVH
jgi:hypothetical protein